MTCKVLSEDAKKMKWILKFTKKENKNEGCRKVVLSSICNWYLFGVKWCLGHWKCNLQFQPWTKLCTWLVIELVKIIPH